MALKRAPVHGGNVYAAARELRRPIGSILDFSASINPLGPSRHAVRVLAADSALIHHYPDPDCVGLKRAIQRRWRIPPDCVVVGNGSTELIDIIPRALSFRSALIVGPTYTEYAHAVSRAGGHTSFIMATMEDEYRPPLEQVTRRLSRWPRGRGAIDAVFICHPNSPTGRLAHAPDLHALFVAANRTGTWVVVDESFIDYCQELTCLSELRRYPRLIIIRSFTKFYGLPGLRIGYSVSSPDVAARLRRFQPPWSVNAVAQRAAEAAIADVAHARRCLACIERERAHLTTQLSSLDGLTVIPSSANFLLVELPSSFGSRALTAELRRRALLVRDCSSLAGCTARMIRIAVRRRRDNERLLAALRRILRR
ncbi:MAG TPA: threonine-phosphate decarboxylase CobD [Nitrospira sp.]|nr:threonine-phosphate decarboxylase CobD [Nitrospira sp.]